jgi:hypothetical protein
MRRPFPTPILAVVLTAASASADVPAAKGQYVVGGTPLEFQDAVAIHRTDWEGAKIVVVLLQKPLDRAVLAGTLDVEGVVEAAKDGTSWAELEFAPDGAWMKARHNLRSGSSTSSGSRSDSSVATMKATIREGRVTGHVRAAFAAEQAIDLTLALPIAEPAAGTALPADGGEPGKALRACNGAFASKKLADLQRLCAPTAGEYIESAVRMKEQGISQDDPWRRDAAGECEVAAVASLTLESGVLAGDQARIRASGGWDGDRKCAGDVFLRRENGKWRVATSRLALTP